MAIIHISTNHVIYNLFLLCYVSYTFRCLDGTIHWNGQYQIDGSIYTSWNDFISCIRHSYNGCLDVCHGTRLALVWF